MLQPDSASPSADVAIATTVEALVQAWAEGWNGHDMLAVARLVTADVEFVTVAGQWLRGRDEFLNYHLQIHHVQMRDSIWTNLGCTFRTLGPDLVLAHLEWTISGDRDPDGSQRLPREGVFTWLLARVDGAWRIAAAHNTNLRPGLRRRLSPDPAPSFFDERTDQCIT